MGISDVIAGFIQSALDETDGVLELQRSDLAQRFNCVPSQINYVMSLRSTATLWKVAGAATATSASRGCGQTAKRC